MGTSAAVKGFLERVGGVLVHPRRTLRAALGHGDDGGRGLGDVALLLCLHLVAGTSRVGSHATDSPVLLARGLMWLGKLEPMLAIQGLLQAASRLLPDVMAIVVGAVALALFAGRRAAGRELDVAALAWVPALAVKTVAALLFTAVGQDPSAAAQQVVDVAALGWAAACWAVALWLMRAAPGRVVEAR